MHPRFYSLEVSEMQRVLFVRGSKAPPWESSVLRELQGFGYDAKFVVPAKSTSVDNDLQIFGTGLKSKSFIEKMLNKSGVARFLNYGLNIKTDEFISRYFNPRKIFKESDILHLTDDVYIPGIQAMNYSTRAVMTVWENIPYHYGIEYGHPTRLYRDTAFRKVKMFLPVTQESATYLRSTGIAEEKIRVVHPGIDVNKFSQPKMKTALAQEMRNMGKFVILGVARIEYFKGLTVVMRALNELAKTEKDFVYVHLGGGSPKFTSYIKNLTIRLGLGQNVRFAGNISYENIPDIYNSCDVFVLPSLPTLLWEEQFGFSVIEAMSAGKPVIVADLPALREVVGEGSGLLFPTGNYIELSKKLSQLMGDPQSARQMGNNARARAYSEFNSRKTAKQYSEIYRTL